MSSLERSITPYSDKRTFSFQALKWCPKKQKIAILVFTKTLKKQIVLVSMIILLFAVCRCRCLYHTMQACDLCEG